jgi:hypothetical protein
VRKDEGAELGDRERTRRRYVGWVSRGWSKARRRGGGGGEQRVTEGEDGAALSGEKVWRRSCEQDLEGDGEGGLVAVVVLLFEVPVEGRRFAGPLAMNELATAKRKWGRELSGLRGSRLNAVPRGICGGGRGGCGRGGFGTDGKRGQVGE